jgi:DNA-binding IclR family transcriptional regulator
VIQSVQRAARILKELGSGTPRLGVTELSERLGLAKATTYGLLRALEAEGLVERDAETGKYRLGVTLLQLGNAFLDTHQLRARSMLWADSLATQSGEAVRVGVMGGSNILIVHHVFRPDDSVQLLEVGASIPWNGSALGKAIVAYLEPARRAALLAGELPRLTGKTITDPKALAAALEGVTTSGFAVEDQEGIVGEAEIAAPIFEHHGVVVGAIGIAGPVERLLPNGPDEHLAAAVKQAARGLSRDMGAGRRAVARGG